MVSAEIALRLLAGVALILTNGFFVAIEFALTRVRQYPESSFDEPRLRRAWDMTDDLEIYLTSCQVGITASSIAVGIVAEPAIAHLVEPVFAGSRLAGIGMGAIIAFAIINLVHLTHGEQTPTYLGVERTKFVCRWGAAPLYYFAWLISPIIRIGDTVAKWTLGLFGVEMTGAWLEAEQEALQTRADLRNELGSVLSQGDLNDERREEVMNALAVGQLPVKEVMVDRSKIIALSRDDSVEENLARLSGQPHTRYPLIGEELEDFLGIVYVPAIIDRMEALQAGEVTFADLAVPPLSVDPDTTVSELVDRFQAESQELALVETDRQVVGLVTATDAFEEIMGEMEDPLDEAWT